MKKIISVITALIISAFALYAQEFPSEAGIYVVKEGTHISIPFLRGSKVGVGGFGVVSNCKYVFKGEKADVEATGEFLLVTDPNLEKPDKSNKNYNPFVNTVTPENVYIIPFEIKGGKRIYKIGLAMDVVDFKDKRDDSVPFTSEKLADNVYSIKTDNLQAGEYGIFIRTKGLHTVDWMFMYGVTVK